MTGAEPGGNNDIVLLSNEFWHRRFGADPGLLGSTLTLDGRGLEVIGILPPGEPWLDAADVFVPLVRDPEARRIGFYLRVIGRLKPGVPAETALADLAAIARRLEQRYPEAAEGIGVGLGPSSDWIAGDRLRRALWILLGAVGLLLAIACVNLANMLLATGTDRLRETAVRAALGAGRRRIARQSLVESLVLGLLGAAAGWFWLFRSSGWPRPSTRGGFRASAAWASWRPERPTWKRTYPWRAGVW